MDTETMIQHFDGLSGEATVSMTMAQALACSHQGPCDADVAAHLDAVQWHATDDRLRRILGECGGWDDVATADRETLRSRMLWFAACDIRENPEMYGA